MSFVDVKTEITGNIWKIVAQVGDQLSENDPIIIMESMKMEIPIMASEDGRLSEVLVSEGEIVTEGSVVARMEV